jgi:peptidoglycan/xylan/chitin deacetylase (PgdA/CDA1 family)
VDADTEAYVGGRLTIIGYHNVEPTHYFEAPAGTGARGFRRQLQLLRRTMHVISLGDAMRRWSEGRELPMRSVCITFDDGYQDALDVAAPILEEHALPATFYLIPTFISGEATAWWERLSWCVHAATAEVTWRERVVPLGAPDTRTQLVEDIAADLKHLDRADREQEVEALVAQLAPAGAYRDDLFLDWDGCRALARRGFEIGSHSTRHAILAREPAVAQRDDLVRSKTDLERELDVAIDGLAYPNGEHGDFSSATFDALRHAGYTHAVTTIPGVNRSTTAPFELRRVVISPVSGPRGLLEGIARCWKPRRQVAA